MIVERTPDLRTHKLPQKIGSILGAIGFYSSHLKEAVLSSPVNILTTRVSSNKNSARVSWAEAYRIGHPEWSRQQVYEAVAAREHAFQTRPVEMLEYTKKQEILFRQFLRREVSSEELFQKSRELSEEYGIPY